MRRKQHSERENGVQREKKPGVQRKRGEGTMLGAIVVDLSFDFISVVHLVCSR